ncbi:MAG: bacteriohemerythrin [Bryobacteraceae bacterium]|jgi:hemerythrin
MSMFEWTQDFAIGMPYIDEQHQALFRYAEELHAAMASGQGGTVVAKTLTRLIEYTEEHFAAEERLMRMHNYPGVAVQRREHQALTQKVKGFAADYAGGQAVVTVQILQFLRSWLDVHIKQLDMQFGVFLKAKAA